MAAYGVENDTISSLMTHLKQQLEDENPYFWINWQSLIFLNSSLEIPCLYGHEPSRYYEIKDCNVQKQLEYPHLYGFISLVHFTSMKLKEPQCISIQGTDKTGKWLQVLETIRHLWTITNSTRSLLESIDSVIGLLRCLSLEYQPFQYDPEFTISLKIVNEKIVGVCMSWGIDCTTNPLTSPHMKAKVNFDLLSNTLHDLDISPSIFTEIVNIVNALFLIHDIYDLLYLGDTNFHNLIVQGLVSQASQLLGVEKKDLNVWISNDEECTVKQYLHNIQNLGIRLHGLLMEYLLKNFNDKYFPCMATCTDSIFIAMNQNEKKDFVDQGESLKQMLIDSIPLFRGNCSAFSVKQDLAHSAACWDVFCFASNITGEPGVFDASFLSAQLAKYNILNLLKNSQGLGFACIPIPLVSLLSLLQVSDHAADRPLHDLEQGRLILTNLQIPITDALIGVKVVNFSWKGLQKLVGTRQQQGDDISLSCWPQSFSQDSTLKHTMGSNPGEVLEKDQVIIEKEAMRLVDMEKFHRRQSVSRCLWVAFSKAVTFCFPEPLLLLCGMRDLRVRSAWREKVALCLIISVISGLMLFFIMGFTLILCPEQRIMTMDEVNRQPTYRPHVIVHGVVYDATPLLAHHINNGASQSHILDWAGKDVSFLFPKPSLLVFTRAQFVKVSPDRLYKRSSTNTHLEQDPEIFDTNEINQEDPEMPVISKNNDVSIQEEITHIHSHQDYQTLLSLPHFCYLGIPMPVLAEGFSRSMARVAIFGAVYDITTIINRWQGLSDRAVVALSPPWGRDKSDAFKYVGAEHDLAVLRDFFVGVMDLRSNMNCLISKYVLIGSTAVLALIMLFKFLAALQLGSKREPETAEKFVIMQVPCYTEGEESLRRTIDSLAALRYDDSRKLLFIVADGMVTGSGNNKSTPSLLLEIFGIEDLDNSPIYACHSISETPGKDVNMAKVYSGLYECGGQRLPYIIVIKVGNKSESTQRGNRGKRDSQMILMRFLSRIFYDEPLCPLELEMYHHMKNVIGVDPAYYEYVLMVDADTVVFPDSLNRMISCCVHDSKVVGICGETRIANEKHSWTTMIQVYEYYISHHMAKAFESLFGTVTCLPGCFCMYRLKSCGANGKPIPLLIDKQLLEDYSDPKVDTLHKKNLLALGEDRFLTTLVLKHFPNHRTKFTPDAVCLTSVPDKWSVLLSQRRRWINSTIHNLFELLMLSDLCGFCCFSMRFIVLMDLYATLVMPASVAYLAYLIFEAFHSKIVPTISLILLASVYGMQVLIFLLKRQWQHIGWMCIHILALPLFGFFIPLYAYWHFDDFTWGNTRRTTGEKNKCDLNDQAAVREEVVPLKSLGEVQTRTEKSYPASLQTTPFASVYSSAGLPLAGFCNTNNDIINNAPRPISDAGSFVNIDALMMNRLEEILYTQELATLTKRKVRHQLEREFGVDLEPRRKWLNHLIKDHLSRLHLSIQ